MPKGKAHIQLLKDIDTLQTVYDRNCVLQVGRFEGVADLLKKKLDKITMLKKYIWAKAQVFKSMSTCLFYLLIVTSLEQI